MLRISVIRTNNYFDINVNTIICFYLEKSHAVCGRFCIVIRSRLSSVKAVFYSFFMGCIVHTPAENCAQIMSDRQLRCLVG